MAPLDHRPSTIWREKQKEVDQKMFQSKQQLLELSGDFELFCSFKLVTYMISRQYVSHAALNGTQNGKKLNSTYQL